MDLVIKDIIRYLNEKKNQAICSAIESEKFIESSKQNIIAMNHRSAALAEAITVLEVSQCPSNQI